MTALRPGASPPPVEIAIFNRSGLPRPDQPQHLPRLGVASDLLLGKHQLAVDRHVEDAAGGLDQLDLDAGNLPAKLRRQTGGAGLGVLNDAILDVDLHRRFSPPGRGAGLVVSNDAILDVDLHRSFSPTGGGSRNPSPPSDDGKGPVNMQACCSRSLPLSACSPLRTSAPPRPLPFTASTSTRGLSAPGASRSWSAWPTRPASTPSSST